MTPTIRTPGRRDAGTASIGRLARAGLRRLTGVAASLRRLTRLAMPAALAGWPGLPELPGLPGLPRLSAWAAWVVLAGMPPAHAAALSVRVLGAQDAPLADAVVAVEVAGEPRSAPPGTTAEMGQRQRRFTPTVLAVQAGTAVAFPNFDTVRHHVYSFSPIKPFEIKLYAGTPAAPIVFDKPGTAVLGCNIHDTMAGFIHVVATPHFAKTDATGQATLDVPPGSHRLLVWHPALGADAAPQAQAVKLPGPPLTVRLPLP